MLVNDAAAQRSPLPGQHRRRGSHPEPGVVLCSLMPQGNGIDPEGQLILGTADRESGLRSARELKEGRVGDAVQLFLEVVVGTVAGVVHPPVLLVVQYDEVFGLRGLPISTTIVDRCDRV